MNFIRHHLDSFAHAKLHAHFGKRKPLDLTGWHRAYFRFRDEQPLPVSIFALFSALRQYDEDDAQTILGKIFLYLTQASLS